MRFSASEVLAVAESTGFRPDMVEKVLHLLDLLDALRSHPFLKGRWVLKGGTALNLFVFDLPRLSVDIDLNYIGSLDREALAADRPRIEQAFQAVFSREGFTIRRIPEEHAGGKWRLGYRTYTGRSGNLEVDLNFMFREPLWEIRHMDSHPLGDFRAMGIPVLDLHELAAGKLAALFSRRQARDLFDCHRLLSMGRLNEEKLRIGFVVYGAMHRRDWRTVSPGDVDFDPEELARHLLPTLHDRAVRRKESVAEYGARLVRECREALSMVLPLTTPEKEFLDLLLEEGTIQPELLTSDPVLQERVRRHPLLAWKALHVRRHKGLDRA